METECWKIVGGAERGFDHERDSDAEGEQGVQIPGVGKGIDRCLKNGRWDTLTSRLTIHSTKPAAEVNDLELDGDVIESNWNQVTDK